MELLLSKDLPLAPFTTTFRAHPELNALPNELFYNGLLANGTDPSDRELLLDVCRTPNPTIPLVVVDVQGTSSRSLSGSHPNPTEAQVCRDIVQSLLAKHVPAASAGIITFYKEQYRLMEQYAAQQRVILHTVDSVQGREMDVVSLLMTRTGLDPARSEFLDDKLRMNVAITRCRHGQFILGRLDDLEKLPNWDRLIRWASERGTIVSTATLPDLFE